MRLSSSSSYAALAGRRFVDSVAYRRFRETGQPQFREFCTGPGPLKAAWRTLQGLTGWGQGALLLGQPGMLSPFQ